MKFNIGDLITITPELRYDSERYQNALKQQKILRVVRGLQPDDVLTGYYLTEDLDRQEYALKVFEMELSQFENHSIKFRRS